MLLLEADEIDTRFEARLVYLKLIVFALRSHTFVANRLIQIAECVELSDIQSYRGRSMVKVFLL